MGRLGLLAVAAAAGGLCLRLLVGPPSPGDPVTALAARGLTVAPGGLRWVPTQTSWLGMQRGALYAIARPADASHGDLWRILAVRGPGGQLLWSGPPRALTQTPEVSERLLLADAHGALVWTPGAGRPGLLRRLTVAGELDGIWQTSPATPPQVQGPLPALEVLGPEGWRPVDVALGAQGGAGPPPQPPPPHDEASSAAPGPRQPPRWPPQTPWAPVITDGGGEPVAQRWRRGGVELFAFHPHRYHGDYVWGAAGPQGQDGSLGAGRLEVQGTIRFTLDADSVGDAGLRVADHAALPLRQGAGTLALDAAGRAGFGLWDLEGPRPPWVTVIQRSVPLVIEGRLMPGRPLARAAGALGVAADGTWLYAVAADAAVAQLGEALVAAGAELAITVSAAHHPTVQFHPEGLGGAARALTGRGSPRPPVAAAGYFALRQRPSRVVGEGFGPLPPSAERAVIATRPGATTLWRLDDDHLAPSLTPGDPLAGWIGRGARPIPGLDGARRAGVDLRPMRPRALTLCGGPSPRLIRWRPLDAEDCPDALQGLALVSEGQPAPGAYGSAGEPEIGLGQDGEGRWLLGRQAEGDRAALAAALVAAGARSAILLGEGSPAGEGLPRWASGEGLPPLPEEPVLYFSSRSGRATAAALEGFDREGCAARRVLRCD